MELLKVKSGGSFFIAFHRDRRWPAVALPWASSRGCISSGKQVQRSDELNANSD